jgi:hypothetical protein
MKPADVVSKLVPFAYRCPDFQPDPNQSPVQHTVLIVPSTFHGKGDRVTVAWGCNLARKCYSPICRYSRVFQMKEEEAPPE